MRILTPRLESRKGRTAKMASSGVHVPASDRQNGRTIASAGIRACPTGGPLLLIGRRDSAEGKQSEPLCPAIDSGVSGNSGSYAPQVGLYYKIGNEGCIDLTVQKTIPVTQPAVQLNIGANFKLVSPLGERIYGDLQAGDPITGPRNGRSATPSRRWRAFSRLPATCFSCRTTTASCTPTTRKPAPSCGTTATAPAIRAAS